MQLDEVLIVCPTLNPGAFFPRWSQAVIDSGIDPFRVLIVDSESDEPVKEWAEAAGFRFSSVKRNEFDHGATRQQAVDTNPEFAYFIFLTQDAIVCDDAFSKILKPFDDDNVGAVCGRQLSRQSAGPIESHAREFNYPDQSRLNTIGGCNDLGLKVAFLSNSFAAYRKSALLEVGGFPDNVIFGEDMFVASKMLLAGMKIAYAADAKVYHSHDYTMLQEFKRYFDMGVFHAREPWIRNALGSAEGAGADFVKSEFKYFLRCALLRIPEAICRNGLRYLGFRLGLYERYIPATIKRRFAMNKGYFN